MQYKFPLKKILDFIPKNDSFSVRTRKDSPKEIRSRGIYMLFSPSFGIFYIGINASDNDAYNTGTPQRLRQHARKLLGITKHGTKQTRNWDEFRVIFFTKDTLDDVEVIFTPYTKFTSKKTLEMHESHLIEVHQPRCNSGEST